MSYKYYICKYLNTISSCYINSKYNTMAIMPSKHTGSSSVLCVHISWKNSTDISTCNLIRLVDPEMPQNLLEKQS